MSTSNSTYLSFEQAINKLEYYCAYQERCHKDVINKMYDLKIAKQMHDAIIVHLIEHNFLNEERFALSFARGKHRISSWGKNRIVTELKIRNISNYLITKALKELDDQMYYSTLEKIALQRWNNLTDTNLDKKKAKIMAYLIRKGYEYELVQDMISYLLKLEQE